MDFTFKTYEKLLNALFAQGFSFLTFAQYTEAKSHNSPLTSHNSPLTSHLSSLTSHLSPLIILRHDVEARYPNALRMAQIENSLGIKGSYYFRIFQNQGNGQIIKQIAAMDHEIGYHYDDLTVCKGDRQNALERFKKNLTYLRQFGRVTTITMEGAPLSKYDNRELWGKVKVKAEVKENPTQIMFRAESRSQPQPEPQPQPKPEPQPEPQPHYTHYGILAEPYFDLNFNQMFYLTDTGRRWDGHRYNIRDKATAENPISNYQFLKLKFHSTHDLINAINNFDNSPAPNTKLSEAKSRECSDSGHQTLNTFPPQAMLNFHPQRWNDAFVPWVKELVWQNVKNQGKRILLKVRSRE